MAFSERDTKFSGVKHSFPPARLQTLTKLSQPSRVKTFNWENCWSEWVTRKSHICVTTRLNHYLHKTHNYVMSEYCFEFLAGRQNSVNDFVAMNEKL